MFTLEKNKLLDSCINGGGDIFEEVRKLRKAPETVANCIDGEKDDIPGYFSTVYGDLYNSAGDKEEVLELKEAIENKVKLSQIEDVQKVTPAIVEEATNNLRNSKTDPVFDFDSDCLKNAPSVLFKHISNLIKSFLIHSHVTSYLLLATFVPSWLI